MTSRLTFRLNGRDVVADGFSPTTTLLQFLRATGRTGTKEGCAEGDCGACSVAILETDAKGEATYRAINACIALLPMFAGREVVTVEGLAAPGAGASPPSLDDLHPVQRAMVQHYGSQCGYCTPGFVMSMFEAYYRRDLSTRPQMSDQLCGNLCRCTGYRPIRDALCDALAQKPAQPDVFQIRLRDRPAPIASCDVAGPDPTGVMKRFVRPTSLEELLALLRDQPAATIVAGATEIGVELNKKLTEFPFLVSTEAIRELRQVERTDETFRVGGAATLTELEEALAGEIPAIDKMLLVFASRQIRNRATLAGNLVTASPIGDMAPVLLALDATITLASAAGERTLELADFFLGYRKTALAPGEIVRWVTIPRSGARGADVAATSGRRLVDSYKVSKRRELDISIVAAAFAIDLDAAGSVTRARLAYGGVAATPVRAAATEAFLVGRPWTQATIDAALPTLAGEFTPLDDARSGAAFRRGVATALFEKFFTGDRSLAQDLPLSFDASPDAPTLGSDDASRSLRHESARGHVSGAAEYVDDQASKRPMLELWPVLSTHARGRIVRRDATKALAVPGVVGVLFAEDIPGDNDIGAIRKDEPLLAPGEISFHGQLVAAVIGESLAACRKAAALVEVDVEPLPAILSIRAAIEAESFHTEPHVIRRGDADAAIAAAPHTVEGELDIGGQEHFYLESQAAWAERGDDGDVFVCSSTQHPSEIQSVVSHVLHLPRSKVVVQAPRMGGGFGGKETQGNAFAALVALSAMRFGRPTRVQLDRDVDMIATGKRHPFLGKFRAGFGDDGRLLGVRAEIVSDGGWALDLSESICDRALFHFDNAYYLPAALVSGRVARTNTVSHTAFRGFGGPQGMLIIEEILDRVARRLGLPPEVVRERNLYRGTGPSNTTHYGQALEDERIPAIWQRLSESSDLAARRASIASWNGASERIKRGIAITPVKFGISFTASFLNQAGALVHVYRDGSVQVNHGGTEMGQGLYVKILGVAMRELGLPEESIRMMKTATDKVPNTSATAASSGSDLNGAAVKIACGALRERLAEVAARALAAQTGAPVDPRSLRFEGNAVHAGAASIPFPAVAELAYLAQVPLSATGFYRTPNLAYDRKRGSGRPFHYFAYGAAVTEVEIDGYSGMKRVLAVDILHDVGASLNPGIDRGQIEGAFVQGLGWLTGEELSWDAQGRLRTHSASTYQIPAISDAPVRFVVELLADATQANVVHGSKAVGEPPLMLAISAREAIRDAIAAFGAPGGEVQLPSPATHEAIFHAVERRRSAAAAARSVAAE